MLSTLVWAQALQEVKADGKITYLTLDQVYCDLGTDAGADQGDTLKVTRGTDEIGLIVVSFISRQSSVCKPLVPAETFQLGDRVHLDKMKSVTETEKPEPETIVKEESPPKKNLPLFKQMGFVSFRTTLEHTSIYKANLRSIGSLQYGVQLSAPIQTRFWLYGRSNITDRDFTLYQARFEFGKSDGRLRTQVGRVYSAELSGIGATDGLYVNSRMSDHFSAGALLGMEPDPLSLKFDSSVKKGGFFTHFKSENENHLMEGSIAAVGRYASGAVDREFIFDRFQYRQSRTLYFTMNQTIDLYRKNKIGNRGSADLTSNQISVRYRPTESITIQSRLSSRKQVLYQTTQLSVPDSLFVDETRSGWYNAVRWTSKSGRSYILGGNYRFQSTPGNHSIYAFFSYNGPYNREKLNFDYTGSFIHNQFITGARNQFGFTKNFGKRGNFYSEYELYLYGYGNRFTTYIQHNITASMSWRIQSKLMLSTSFDATIDKDYTLYYLYLSCSYRF